MLVESRLNYNPQPMMVPYTRSLQNPSIFNLVIQVTPKNTQQTLDCSVIYFKINVGDSETDLVASADAGKINPTSLQPSKWTIAKFSSSGAEVVYKAMPVAPNTGFGIDETAVFELQGVVVNTSGPGSTPLQIADMFTGSSFLQFDIFKEKTSLIINKFQSSLANIQAGGTVTLSWETTAAAQVTLEPTGYYKIVNGKPVYNPDLEVNDSVFYTVQENTTFTLTARGDGSTVSSQYTVSVPPVIIKSFNADPKEINARGQTTLTWTALNAETCKITAPGVNFDNLPLQGNKTVTITEDTVFTLTATSLAGTNQQLNTSVTVYPVKITSFIANPAIGARIGDSVNLSWVTQSATSLSLNGSLISNDLIDQGNKDIEPTSTTTYKLVATGTPQADENELTIFPLQSPWGEYATDVPNFLNPKPVVLSFNNKLWFLAGGPTNRIYSTYDCSSWLPYTLPSSWPVRSKSAGIVFDSKIWIMGGSGNTGGPLNDVWNSADGKTWNCITTMAEWSARHSFGLFQLGDKLFVIGGIDGNNNGLSDVWSSTNGQTWVKETSAAFSVSKAAFATVSFDSKIWVLGGLNNGNESTGSPSNEVWYSSDGIYWNSAGNANWLPRFYLNAQAVGSKLYVAGGLSESGGTPINDLYSLSGTPQSSSWVTLQGFGSMQNVLAASCNYQEAFWFIGGSLNNDGKKSPNSTVWAFAPPL